MLDIEKIGKQIQLLRKEKGYTGERLAEMLDVSPQAISKWENGRCLPETQLLPELARVLGCTIDALLMPRELLVLEAVVADGKDSVDITQFINENVRDNKLNITVNKQCIPAAPESDRLIVLMLKYQTPRGVYYTFAAQDDILAIDKDCAGEQNSAPFAIIGAYYGNAAKRSNAMQKMRHYEYFNWGEIEVNHETFPSITASEDIEYLTLVYLNKSGIHCISCPENEALRYSAGKTSLSLVDSSCRILEGVQMLEWDKGMECPWAGALYAALKYMGEGYSYEQIMGMSGACYRLNFVDVWDWSCTDALVAFDYSAILFPAIGYKPIYANRLEKAERKAERQRIVADIKSNKPVIAINLRIAPEWGVITGYLDNGNEFLCRTYFDKFAFAEHADDESFCKDTGGYLVNDFWPFLITHFGEKIEKPSPEQILRNSLQALIDSFNAEQCRGYYQGKEAYAAWIKALSAESDFVAADIDSVKRRLGVNDSMLLCLADARRCAAAYIAQSAQLLPEQSRPAAEAIARNFAEIHKSVADFHASIKINYDIPDTTSNNGASTPQLRKQQIDILTRALALEQANAELAQGLLNS